jgi:hypothetical protein
LTTGTRPTCLHPTSVTPTLNFGEPAIAISFALARLVESVDEPTDSEVAKDCEYWTARLARYRVEGEGLAAWQASKRLCEGHSEVVGRGLTEKSVESSAGMLRR